MSIKPNHIEYVIETMDERIQFLKEIINVCNKKVEESNGYGYAKGLYEGSEAAHQDEIDFLQRRRDFLNRILEENKSSEEIV